MDSVELIPAHNWHCDQCGEENFSRSIVADLSEEDMDELRFEHGVDVLEEGHFLTAPKTVKCHLCHTMFETRQFGE